MTAIKICRIFDIHTARLCGDLGVEFVGLHAITRLTKVKSEIYRNISNELKAFYPKTSPVLVTKIKKQDQLVEMVKITGINVLQLHYPLTSHVLSSIRDVFKKSLGYIPIIFSVVAADDVNSRNVIKEIKKLCDYILIDASYRGGTGIKVLPETLFSFLEEAHPTKCFIAGGLDSYNVRNIINDFHPYGIDAQSSLEFTEIPRYKDPKLLIKFTSTVREEVNSHIDDYYVTGNVIQRKLVSLALTSIPNNIIVPTLDKFYSTDIDLYHLDFSDKSVAPHFEAFPYNALSQASQITPCIPYDVHLFIRSVSKQESILHKCISYNPLLRLALFQFDQGETQIEPLLSAWIKLADKMRIHIGIALQATKLNPVNLKHILVTMSKYPIKEVSLITRSSAHSLAEVKQNDLALLMEISHFLKNIDHPIHISVDRDMNFKKLKILSLGNPTHVVVGANLLMAKQPQRMITQLRQLLATSM